MLVVCGVIGQTNFEHAMVVKALVILKPGHTADMVMVKTLQKHIKSTLPPFKYPRQIELRNPLPHTKAGKLRRHKLHEP